MEIELMAEFLEEFEEYLGYIHMSWILNGDYKNKSIGDFIDFAYKKATEDKLVKRGPDAKSYEDLRRI